MREIKFRAWDSKLETWIPNNQSDYVFNSSHFIEDGLDISTHYHKAKHVIFMQFTGLKDKNSKDIYEGDIVNAEHHCGKGEVVYGFGDASAFVIKYKNPIGAETYHPLGIIDYSDIEVIGNIKENPELIK